MKVHHEYESIIALLVLDYIKLPLLFCIFEAVAHKYHKLQTRFLTAVREPEL